MAQESSYWSLELERQSEAIGDKTFVYLVYGDRSITYKEMDQNANRLANYLLTISAQTGDGLATLMGNSQQFLDVFFGIQKIGMYVNPANTSLRGEGLAFIIDNSDAKYLVVDHDKVDLLRSIESEIPKIKHVIVNTLEAPPDYTVPKGMLDLRDAYGKSMSTAKPEVTFSPDSLLLIMYTSGTTGLPKGVVFRYNKNLVDKIKLLAQIAMKPDSIYYTPLALFHGNALFVTTTQVLVAGTTVALSKKFSASRFWEEVWRSGATVFNTIGAMIPILMRQPPHPHEKDHKVSLVISAGCPADMWEPFEKRFNVTLWEAYGAIDGTGTIMNLGNAPKGSVGSPMLSEIRLVDEAGKDVPVGETGELLFKVSPDKKSTVEYYKDIQATERKTKGEWEHTGDYMYQDDKGFLYFVGRKTDSMRRRGENVSAYEVEKVILKNPKVQECAVYGVPSEMTEDEIMASVTLVSGERLSPAELREFLRDKLAPYAIPRYIRIIDDFPRTETFRIKKNELKALGVTPDTFDAEKS
ncbi:MAG: AMP-binding protein [Deltaproteobacteria bacterium]|nr:AMP-binding protein [Deltaproteobacteria bacterium]